MAKQFTRLFVALMAAHWVGGAAADDGHPMRHHFPQDVDAFHSVLAPIWHARPGKERSRNACAKAGDMESLARDIRSADATPLAASVASLKVKCQGGEAEVDAALFDVHEAFHRLIEPRPAAAGG